MTIVLSVLLRFTFFYYPFGVLLFFLEMTFARVTHIIDLKVIHVYIAVILLLWCFSLVTIACVFTIIPENNYILFIFIIIISFNQRIMSWMCDQNHEVSLNQYQLNPLKIYVHPYVWILLPLLYIGLNDTHVIKRNVYPTFRLKWIYYCDLKKKRNNWN